MPAIRLSASLASIDDGNKGQARPLPPSCDKRGLAAHLVSGELIMVGPAQRETINNIQVLRGFAALLVVLFHLGPAYGPIGIPHFGGGGVDVFFVISGFIMAHTSWDRPLSPASFLGNRIRRIVPLYWIMTGLVFSLALLLPGMMKRAHGSPAELLKSLFFIPFERDGLIADPVLFLGWTLNYEMFFYLAFAVGLLLPGRSSLALPIFGLILLVGAGSLADIQSPVLRFYTDPIMLEFCFGMVVAILLGRVPSQVPASVKWSALATAILSAALVILIPVYWRDVSRAFLSGAPSFLLVAAAVTLEKWGWRMNNRMLLAIGASSYSLYLTHIFITEVTIRAVGLFKLDAFIASLAAIVGACLSCIVGWLTYIYIETPIHRRLVRAGKGRYGMVNKPCAAQSSGSG